MSRLVRQYLIRSGALALALAIALSMIFIPRSTVALLFAVLGWAPMALIGVVGGGWAVSRFGRVGVGFPLAVLTCILLRLSLGLGGLALAGVYAQVVPYLVASLATFAAMQVYEMLWFLRRNRLQLARGALLARVG